MLKLGTQPVLLRDNCTWCQQLQRGCEVSPWVPKATLLSLPRAGGEAGASCPRGEPHQGRDAAAIPACLAA